MELIAHRVNKISKLRKLSKQYGAEIDLRSKGSKIILHHNPFQNGDYLNDYLNNYNHGTLILNVKESGIENEIIKLVKKSKIKNFFLLDSEMPVICTNKAKINRNFAVRFSEYETIDTAKKFINNIGWIWIDTFNSLPINKNNIKIIKNFKSCLVCPERWGRPNDIKSYYKKLKNLNFKPSAVMTSLKYIKMWENLLIRD